MHFAAHADPLHEATGRLVVDEAAGRDPPHAEVLEAVADQLPHGFCRVAAAGVGRVEGPAELGLYAASLLDDLGLRPGVLAAKHEVADDGCCGCVAACDDDGRG